MVAGGWRRGSEGARVSGWWRLVAVGGGSWRVVAAWVSAGTSASGGGGGASGRRSRRGLCRREAGVGRGRGARARASRARAGRRGASEWAREWAGGRDRRAWRQPLGKRVG